MTLERVYIAGPMTGIPLYNFPAFEAAADDLRRLGYDVVSPRELDAVDGIVADPEGKASPPEQYAHFLSRDLYAIATVQAVALLPGWESSGGVSVELAFARTLGLKVYRYDGERQVNGPALIALDKRTEPLRVDVKVDGKSLGAFEPASWSPWGESAHEFGGLVHPGEVRVTNATTGGAKGQKPERMDLLPWGAVLEVSRVYGFGAAKYEDRNWERGYEVNLSYGALQRHLAAYWTGEDKDPESGLPHLAHAGFHVLALLHFHAHPEKYGALDNRPVYTAEAAA